MNASKLTLAVGLFAIVGLAACSSPSPPPPPPPAPVAAPAPPPPPAPMMPANLTPKQQQVAKVQMALNSNGAQLTVDGKWGSDSVDALKHFQKEQGLDPDGKLGSLSLIAMGLGPKRLAAQASMPPPAGTQR